MEYYKIRLSNGERQQVERLARIHELPYTHAGAVAVISNAVAMAAGSLYRLPEPEPEHDPENNRVPEYINMPLTGDFWGNLEEVAARIVTGSHKDAAMFAVSLEIYKEEA